jgi:hypothetical protein
MPEIDLNKFNPSAVDMEEFSKKLLKHAADLAQYAESCGNCKWRRDPPRGTPGLSVCGNEPPTAMLVLRPGPMTPNGQSASLVPVSFRPPVNMNDPACSRWAIAPHSENA